MLLPVGNGHRRTLNNRALEERLHFGSDVVQSNRLCSGTLSVNGDLIGRKGVGGVVVTKIIANLFGIASERSDVRLDPGDGDALIEYTIVTIDVIRIWSSSVEAKNTCRCRSSISSVRPK